MYLMRRTPRVTFTILLGNVPMQVHALYRQTKKFCRDYLTDEPPAFSISICREELREERKRYAAQAEKEGRLKRYANRYLETLVLCRKIASELMAHDILLFHGAVMAVDGKAYLFTAASGTGKTTHCRLWLKHIPNCHILNGDKPLLLFKHGKVYACGSPWMGKEQYGINETLPLEGLCLLERDDSNHITEITVKDGFKTLINQCHIPEGNGNFIKAVHLIRQLSGVKLYRLGCNMEADAATVAYQALSDNN